MRKFCRKLLANRTGATAIEYGLIGALISIVVISGVSSVGTSLNKTFGTIASSIKGA